MICLSAMVWNKYEINIGSLDPSKDRYRFIRISQNRRRKPSIYTRVCLKIPYVASNRTILVNALQDALEASVIINETTKNPQQNAQPPPMHP
jgi:hypothetical protein